MYRLQSLSSLPCKEGRMHVVQLPNANRIPDWLINTQIELDGTRVFVRSIHSRIDDGQQRDDRVIGLIVSPVY